MRPMTMMRTERRRGSRMAVEGLAYVNLEPSNGGIVLNISEGGLCFHSSTPVEQPSAIRFWFAQRYPGPDGRLAKSDDSQMKGATRFIEAECTLAWTDEKRRMGGLQFTNMPAEAREEIRNWIGQHARQGKVEERPTLAPASLPKVDPVSVRVPEVTAARHVSVSAAVANQMTAALPQHSVSVPALPRLRGFSGGLAAGIAASAVLVGVFLLGAHSRELGQSLIHLGQRVGGDTEPGVAAANLQPGPSETPKTTKPAETVSNTVVPPPQSGESDAPITDAGKAHEPKAGFLTAGSAAVRPIARGKVASTLTSGAPVPPQVTEPNDTVGPPLDANLGMPPGIAPKTENGHDSIVRVERSRKTEGGTLSEKFLEVGTYKERAWSNKTIEKLGQLGFHTIVLQKGGLWKKSYHVLVGPFDSDQEAEVAHKDLATRGFTPRSFERGSRDFNIRTPMKLNGTSIPLGECVVRWESYMPDAIVKFEDYRGFGVTAEGKWVQRGVRYPQDAIVYRLNADGSRTLSELQFSGKGQALVFDKGSI
jgi:hypothetical protein